MGSVVKSIDVSLPHIWKIWYEFRKGKKRTTELDTFTYCLEENLEKLHKDLVTGNYQHGLYRTFPLTDTKRRLISVASIRDRVVHRLLYEYLTPIFDKTFIYDAWSCRQGKGLLSAILRAQKFLQRYRYAYVWRSDVTKFFDNVDQNILLQLLCRKVKDVRAIYILGNIIRSYSIKEGIGIPIGNLTSQIFTNIYFHEFDWYIKHTVKPLAYMRYGDDFIFIDKNKDHVQECQEHLTIFLDRTLKLTINEKNNIVVPARWGIHFLGCDIYPTGRRLRKRIYQRIEERLNLVNSPSYRALILTHSKQNIVKWIDWHIMNILSII